MRTSLLLFIALSCYAEELKPIAILPSGTTSARLLEVESQLRFSRLENIYLKIQAAESAKQRLLIENNALVEEICNAAKIPVSECRIGNGKANRVKMGE